MINLCFLYLIISSTTTLVVSFFDDEEEFIPGLNNYTILDKATLDNIQNGLYSDFITTDAKGESYAFKAANKDQFLLHPSCIINTGAFNCKRDRACLAVGDCCHDYLSDTWYSLLESRGPPVSCRDVLTDVEYKIKKTIAVISGCPKSFTNTEILAKCRPSPCCEQEMIDLAVDPTTGDVFENAFCAVCNGVQDPIIIPSKRSCANSSIVDKLRGQLMSYEDKFALYRDTCETILSAQQLTDMKHPQLNSQLLVMRLLSKLRFCHKQKNVVIPTLSETNLQQYLFDWMCRSGLSTAFCSPKQNIFCSFRNNVTCSICAHERSFNMFMVSPLPSSVILIDNRPSKSNKFVSKEEQLFITAICDLNSKIDTYKSIDYCSKATCSDNTYFHKILHECVDPQNVMEVYMPSGIPIEENIIEIILPEANYSNTFKIHLALAISIEPLLGGNVANYVEMREGNAGFIYNATDQMVKLAFIFPNKNISRRQYEKLSEGLKTTCGRESAELNITLVSGSLHHNVAENMGALTRVEMMKRCPNAKQAMYQRAAFYGKIPCVQTVFFLLREKYVNLSDFEEWKANLAENGTVVQQDGFHINLWKCLDVESIPAGGGLIMPSSRLIGIVMVLLEVAKEIYI